MPKQKTTNDLTRVIEGVEGIAPLPDSGYTVHQRMLAVLSELPAIGKTEFNQQQKFHFRGHDAVMNALNPLLAKHGVLVIPDVLERVVAQRTTSKGSIMYEVNLHVRYRFYGAGGDMIEASTWGEGTDMGDKATNKAMTMAFKNVLNQAFAISNEEFSDSDSGTPEETYSRVGAAPGTAADAAAPTIPLPASFPAGEDLGKRVGEALRHANPSIDWRATWENANLLRYEMERSELPPREKAESLIRLAHVADSLSRYGDFPIWTDEEIAQAFFDAFQVVKAKPLELIVHHEPAEPAPVTGETEPDDQIPFGE